MLYKYEPPKRRLRIRNKIRFIVSLIILFTVISILIPDKGTSQVEFTEYQVSYGDTYWGIAQDLQRQGYRPRADIRDIVYELISKSGIPAHELKEGDTIYIPDWEGSK